MQTGGQTWTVYFISQTAWRIFFSKLRPKIGQFWFRLLCKHFLKLTLIKSSRLVCFSKPKSFFSLRGMCRTLCWLEAASSCSLSCLATGNFVSFGFCADNIPLRCAVGWLLPQLDRDRQSVPFCSLCAALSWRLWVVTFTFTIYMVQRLWLWHLLLCCTTNWRMQDLRVFILFYKVKT